MTLRERIAKGAQARDLLDSAMLIDVLEQVEHNAISQWRIARGPMALSTREHSHAVVVGIDEVKGQLRLLIDDGELARSELDEAEEDQE